MANCLDCKKDCTFDFLKRLIGGFDDHECPNYNDETDTVEMEEED